MYELLQGTELEAEYQQMTLDQEEELVSQLKPREKAEYCEMKEY